MKINKLIWDGNHKAIKVVEAIIEINVEENGGRGKPKKRLIDRIQNDS